MNSTAVKRDGVSGLARPDARHQCLGVGLPREFDELGVYTLIEHGTRRVHLAGNPPARHVRQAS